MECDELDGQTNPQTLEKCLCTVKALWRQLIIPKGAQKLAHENVGLRCDVEVLYECERNEHSLTLAGSTFAYPWRQSLPFRPTLEHSSRGGFGNLMELDHEMTDLRDHGIGVLLDSKHSDGDTSALSCSQACRDNRSAPGTHDHDVRLGTVTMTIAKRAVDSLLKRLARETEHKQRDTSS
jgi:hypothetical protein